MRLNMHVALLRMPSRWEHMHGVSFLWVGGCAVVVAVVVVVVVSVEVVVVIVVMGVVGVVCVMPITFVLVAVVVLVVAWWWVMGVVGVHMFGMVCRHTTA
jgi:hypothetical protein